MKTLTNADIKIGDEVFSGTLRGVVIGTKIAKSGREITIVNFNSENQGEEEYDYVETHTLSLKPVKFDGYLSR